MATSIDRSDPGGRVAEVRARPAGAERVPYPIRIRRLEVLRTERLGSAIVRVTLGGPGLDGFVSLCPTEHVRLVFPDPDGTLRLPEPDGQMLRWPRPMPPSREYTVRRFDADAGELDVDLVLHDGGLAAGWAERVSPGEEIDVAGPPGGVAVADAYDHLLLAGDITALPAIGRWLEEMPAGATGWAFVEVADASEEVQLTAPPGVAVRWVHRGPVPPGSTDALAEAVRTVRVPDGGTVFAWVAGEAGAIRPLRRWVRDELGLGRDDHIVTGYWKRGVADFDEDDD